MLVLVASEHLGPALDAEIERRAGGRQVELRLVAPALAESRLEHLTGQVDEGRENAQELLEQAAADLDHDAIDDAKVGDADPILAIEDTLYEFEADEILIVTHPASTARPQESDLFERAARHFPQAVSHFVIDEEADVVGGEEADPGALQERDNGVGPGGNLPRFSPRDIAGMVFAVIGTFVLWMIAATNPDETRSGFDFDALHLIIAGALTLINLAHIVGVLFFESLGVRGAPQRFFANFSLYGTAAAVAVSLLLLLH